MKENLNNARFCCNQKNICHFFQFQYVTLNYAINIFFIQFLIIYNFWGFKKKNFKPESINRNLYSAQNLFHKIRLRLMGQMFIVKVSKRLFYELRGRWKSEFDISN